MGELAAHGVGTGQTFARPSPAFSVLRPPFERPPAEEPAARVLTFGWAREPWGGLCHLELFRLGAILTLVQCAVRSSKLRLRNQGLCHPSRRSAGRARVGFKVTSPRGLAECKQHWHPVWADRRNRQGST